VLDGVVKAHVLGTRYGIGVDPADGLLRQGQPGYALTWMDARVDGIGVTPRIGKAVEINALWVNGLAALRTLHARLGSDATEVAQLHERARSSFGARYPTGSGGLYDVVDGPAGDDDTTRPNQLLAFSLPHAPLTDPGAVRALAAPLLTPLGLRSLAPGSPGYRGRHRGGPRDRDSAYHQGTVWPWLIGPYLDACQRTGVPADGVLAGLTSHLAEWGLGSVSETADGDAPHAATGCPFQAWSVAELNRVIQLTAPLAPRAGVPAQPSGRSRA
jgi:predicted glycogen debranching enzyme